jgi:hypothetical protein
MSSRDEVELAELKAAQEQLKRQVARIDQQLEKLADRITAKAVPPVPAETARARPPEPAPEQPAMPVFVEPPRSIPVPPPLPTAVRAPRKTATVERASEPVAALPVNATPGNVQPITESPRTAPLSPPVSPPPTPSSALKPPTESFEFRLGTVWLVRIGVVILLTGLVFLGNYAYHNIVGRLGPGGKLALLYVAAGGLAGLGAWLGRRHESVRGYAKVLLSGGAATAYYATYAAHFVERLRVIESPLVGGLALLAMAGAVLLLADRQKSEPLALLSVVLAYYTSAINPIGSFTLFSSLLLTAMAVFFLVRHRWVRIPFASLAGTYGSYAYWRFVGEGNVHTGLAWNGVAFLAAAWAMYTVAVFLTRRDLLGSGARVAFLTANNGAFFAGAAQAFAVQAPHDFWIFALGFGAILLALSLFAWRREAGDERLDGAYLAQGLAVVTLGLGAKITEQRLAMTLAVESVVLVTCSRWRHALIYHIGAGLCALAAACIAAAYLLDQTAGAATTGALVAALFLADTWLLKRDAADKTSISERALCFSLLALGLIALNLWQSAAPDWRGEAFALAVVVSVASINFLGLLEIALPGQLLLAGSVATWLLRRINGDVLPWWQPFPSVAVIFALSMWWKRVSVLNLPGAGIARLYRILGSALLIAWGFQEIPDPLQPIFFCGLGALVVLAAGWRRNAEALISGVVFALTGFVVFWLRGSGAPSGLDLTAILIFAIAWRAAALLGAAVPEFARHYLPGLVAFNVSLWATRWSNALTVAWSLLALALFFAGLGLRERAYRLGGLVLLALAVGRIFLIDVWRFETLTRIVSFLVLGAVLMLLGYLYNRFGEKLREWL